MFGGAELIAWSDRIDVDIFGNCRSVRREWFYSNASRGAFGYFP